MQPLVFIEIPGPAVPERKRSRVVNGHAGRSDTPEAKSYKNHVKACAAAAMAGRPPLEGPLALEVGVIRLRPKSCKRVLFPVTRPDCSNYLKILEDACNGIVWRDDAQLVSVRIRKLFGDRAVVVMAVETVQTQEWTPRPGDPVAYFAGEGIVLDTDPPDVDEDDRTAVIKTPTGRLVQLSITKIRPAGNGDNA